MKYQWIKKYLSDDQIEQISTHIVAAEKKTRGEIVPVIVHSSVGTGHVPVIISLFMTLALALIPFPQLDWLFHGYGMLLWPLILMLFYFLGRLLNKFFWVQKALTADADEQAAVWRRAELEFYRNKVNKTDEGVGILIFISLMEHRAIILGDRAVAEKVAPETWDQLVQDLVSKIKHRQFYKGLTDTIHQCGQILSTHFPIDPSDKNELSNQLVIKE